MQVKNINPETTRKKREEAKTLASSRGASIREYCNLKRRCLALIQGL